MTPFGPQLQLVHVRETCASHDQATCHLLLANAGGAIAFSDFGFAVGVGSAVQFPGYGGECHFSSQNFTYRTKRSGANGRLGADLSYCLGTSNMCQWRVRDLFPIHCLAGCLGRRVSARCKSWAGTMTALPANIVRGLGGTFSEPGTATDRLG